MNFNNEPAEVLSSIIVVMIIAFVACEIFGYCICFTKNYFGGGESLTLVSGPPMGMRMSRLGKLSYDKPYNVNLRTQKKILL